MEPMQLFLIVNTFILGAITALIIERIWRHYHPHEFNVDPSNPHGEVHLPMAVKERLLKVAEADYEEVLNKSVSDFKGDLRQTTSRITDSLTQFSGDILGEEMDRYKNTLVDLRAKAEATRSQAQTDVERHQTEIEALIAERQKLLEKKLIDRYEALESQAAKEADELKQAYIARIDNKLADSVTSFLAITLQYNADLGAQEQYLLAELEKHKNELIQDVHDAI